jgi:hypothetical protein
MANRSYLYTRHRADGDEFRDLAEWNYDVPISHLLLVGADATPCKSAIWQVDEKIAIEGNAEHSRALFLAFLDWLEPQMPKQFHRDAEEARAMLNRADRQGEQFHLECGEIYELEGLDLPGMESATSEKAKLAEELFLDAKEVVGTPGATVKDFRHKMLRGLHQKWEERLGLYFSQVLYFHLGG